jgi:hypothetical protein
MGRVTFDDIDESAFAVGFVAGGQIATDDRRVVVCPSAPADLLQELAAVTLPHRDDCRALETVAHPLSRRPVLERSDADGVNHHRNVELLCDEGLAQEHLGFVVEQDAAAADYQDIEPRNFGGELLARQFASRNRAFDIVAPCRVLGVSAEDSHLGRHRPAQFRDDALEDCLVTDVPAAV